MGKGVALFLGFILTLGICFEIYADAFKNATLIRPIKNQTNQTAALTDVPQKKFEIKASAAYNGFPIEKIETQDPVTGEKQLFWELTVSLDQPEETPYFQDSYTAITGNEFNPEGQHFKITVSTDETGYSISNVQDYIDQHTGPESYRPPMLPALGKIPVETYLGFPVYQDGEEQYSVGVEHVYEESMGYFNDNFEYIITGTTTMNSERLIEPFTSMEEAKDWIDNHKRIKPVS